MTLDPFIPIETYDKLPAERKADYVQQGNEYMLDVRKVEKEVVDPTTGQKRKGVFALEDVGGLRSALESERTEKKTLEGRVKSIEGLDIPKAKQALIDVEAMKTWTSDDKLTAKMKERDEQLEAKHKGELAPLQTKLQTKQAQLERVLVENTAVVALTAAGVKPEGIKLLLPHVKSFIKIKENEQGELVTEVVDERGIARVSMKTGNTGAMDIPELIEDMKRKPEYAPAFPGSGSTGSGSSANSGRTGGSNGVYTITQEEAKDLALYRRRKEEAQKAGRQLQIVE